MLRILRKLLKRFFLLLGFFLLVIILFGEDILHFLWHDLPFMGREFDSKVWVSTWDCTTQKTHIECALYREKSERCSIYSELTDYYLSIGTPKQKVTELLGKTEIAYNSLEAIKHPECINYPLGYCSGLHIDLDLLRICFDDNNKIKTVGHFQT